MLIDNGALKKIFDQFPFGVILAGEDGEILLANDKFPAILEVDPIDLMEIGIAAAPAWCGLADTILALGKEAHGRQSVESTHNKRRFVLTVARDGIFLFENPCQVVMIYDVTHEKELEELRSGFFSQFLKRIKGPLTSVKTALSVLSSDDYASTAEEARELAQLGFEEVQRMHGLLSGLSDLFALDTHSAGADMYLEDVDIGSILSRCLRRALKSPRGLNRKISLLTPVTQSCIVADFEKLGSVLGHLLDNALSYSPTSAPVIISTLEAGGVLEIRIEDSGSGIAPGDLPKVFDKFFRSSQPSVAMTEGGGLGLFLAKGFTELMGGALALESRPGRTTAIISFPLAHEAGTSL